MSPLQDTASGRNQRLSCELGKWGVTSYCSPRCMFGHLFSHEKVRVIFNNLLSSKEQKSRMLLWLWLNCKLSCLPCNVFFQRMFARLYSHITLYLYEEVSWRKESNQRIWKKVGKIYVGFFFNFPYFPAEAFYEKQKKFGRKQKKSYLLLYCYCCTLILQKCFQSLYFKTCSSKQLQFPYAIGCVTP